MRLLIWILKSSNILKLDKSLLKSQPMATCVPPFPYPKAWVSQTIVTSINPKETNKSTNNMWANKNSLRCKWVNQRRAGCRAIVSGSLRVETMSIIVVRWNDTFRSRSSSLTTTRSSTHSMLNHLWRTNRIIRVLETSILKWSKCIKPKGLLLTSYLK